MAITSSDISTIKTAYDAQNAKVPVNSNVITAASLAPTPTIPVATPVVTPISTAPVMSDLASGLVNAQSAVDAQTANAKSTAGDISRLQSLLGGKGADTANTYQETGVNKLYNQVSDLNSQAQGLNLEAQAIPIQTQQNNANTGATDAGVAPQTAGALRENALKALSLGQQYAIASGNYDKAKNYADQIISAKYDQMEADIKAKQTNLDSIKEFDLTPAEKKLATAQQAVLTKQAQDIADKKEQAKVIQDTLIKASSFNAPQSVIDAINKAPDANSAIAAAKGYLTDPLDTQLKKAQIAEAYSKVNENNNTAKDQKIVKINGTDYVQNKDGSFSLPKLPTTPGGDANKSAVQNKIAQIGAVIGAKGESSAVGTNFLSRQGAERTATRILTLGTTGLGVGNRANFTATVEQITKGLTLQALIDAKANGATFGALSEGELRLLADSASKIDNYAVKDDKGKVKYYKANEADFNNELKTLQDGLQKAYDIKYGTTDANNYLDTVSSALKNNTSIYSQAGYNVNQ